MEDGGLTKGEVDLGEDKMSVLDEIPDEWDVESFKEQQVAAAKERGDRLDLEGQGQLN